jgi:predicted nucleic acid-binding protein
MHVLGRTPQHALEQGPTRVDEREPATEAGRRLADHTPQVVLDTKVFVGAGFNPRSHSALLLDAVRVGRLRMVWDDATREEIEHVLRRIPRLTWGAVAQLFREEERFDGATHPDQFGYVPDPTDRKFAALADAANVPLVTSDRGLLNAQGQAPFPILKPSEFALDH